jgi:hypothetical protein
MNSALGNGVKTRKPKGALKSKWAFCGKKSAIPQIEDELYAYVIDLRKSVSVVSAELLQFGTFKIT